MSITAVDFIPAGMPLSEISGLTAKPAASSFVNWLEKEMGTVNEQILSADLQVRQLAAGEHDNLHQVMMSLEKAKLGFELCVQVRNRLLEGYQDIMRMQV